MKILHTAFMGKATPGIVAQMRWEQQSAAETGLDWEVRIFCPAVRQEDQLFTKCDGLVLPKNNGLLGKIIFWVNFRRAYYKWLESNVDTYDQILLRHSVYNPFQLLFLLKRKESRIYLVHHTLEIPEIRMERNMIKRIFKICTEAVVGGLAIRLSAGVIAVTPEILNYEKSRLYGGKKKGFVYPNGISYGAGQAKVSPIPKSGIPSFIFVSSYFSSWHGLDLLLDGVQSSNDEFVLHLVGELATDQMARALSDPRIVVHGSLNGDQIAELSRQCWVGLASFGLHRSHMKQACTLKVREYLKNGLPVYAGYEDVFPEAFPFYKFGAPNVSSMVSYARSVKDACPEQVSMTAKPFISKSIILARLHQWLAQQQD